MLIMLASSIVFTELKATLFQMFTAKVKSLWQEWELRCLLLLSLSLQITLVIFGDRRKFTGRSTPWVAMIVWSTYLMADWVATVSLSTLMKSEGELCTKLVVLWAPFLLLHLGGPDSITAYSLEDNDLWLRHFLTLCIQVAVASYVYWKFQTNNAIAYIAILIFVAGIIKYGERIVILRRGSSKRLRQSLLAAPEPKHDEVTAMTRLEERVDLDTYLSRVGIIPGARYLHEAYLLFNVFKPLFADLTLRIYNVLLNDVKAFTMKSKLPDNAFQLVEVELGFLYDTIYTKRTLLNSPIGAILRAISFLSSCTALAAFAYFVGFNEEESMVDIGISYLLLFGAVALDIYSVIAHCLSNWAMLWVTHHRNWPSIFAHQVTSSHFFRRTGKEGFRSMAQFNLINFSLQSNTSKVGAIESFLDTDIVLRKYWYTTWEPVSPNLKKLIYTHLLMKRERYENHENREHYNYEFLGKMLSKRGDGVLEGKRIGDHFKWSITEVEFNHSLLIWHIATDLCYHDDGDKYGYDFFGSHYKMSKTLSDYMLYLQVIRPFMLPKGISEVRFRDTCNETMRFLQKKEEFDSGEVCRALLFDSEDRPYIPIPGKSKSVLFEGVKLANQLKQLVRDERWDLEEKWELISNVWVEMLTYAAARCNWKEHTQQLQRGRELLTHVSLLMAHLGLTEKIHIVELPEMLKMISYQPPWKWDTLYHLAYYLA